MCDQVTMRRSWAVAGAFSKYSSAHDLRIVTWSHIYLGRLDDLDGKRDAALAQSRAALLTAAAYPMALRAAKAEWKPPSAHPQARSKKNNKKARPPNVMAGASFTHQMCSPSKKEEPPIRTVQTVATRSSEAFTNSMRVHSFSSKRQSIRVLLQLYRCN